MPSKSLRENTEITDSKAIANKVFISNGNNLTQSIPDTNKSVMSFMEISSLIPFLKSYQSKRNGK